MIKHIILIGFMGSGKSTYGKLLANKMGYSFVDTDHYIERKEGRSINDIFSDDGEEYFRNLETEVLGELMEKSEPQVLALGGGTPLKEQNRKLIKDGYTIFLKITADEAYDRLKDDAERPLLNVKDPKTKIEELLSVRNPIYEKAADYVLVEKNKTLDDIFYELSKLVREL